MINESGQREPEFQIYLLITSGLINIIQWEIIPLNEQIIPHTPHFHILHSHSHLSYERLFNL